MNILFLSHYFPPEGNAPANRVFNLCKNWVKAGHGVTVITCAPNVPDGKVYDGYRNRICQRETMGGIEVIRVWTWMAPNRGTFLRGLNYLTYCVSSVLVGLFAARPDVLVATSPQFFCGIAGALLKKLRRIPFVLEVRDIWPESIEAVGGRVPGVGFRVLALLERWMYRTGNRIVTVGPGYRDRLIGRGVPPEKIHIFPNGVDADRFRPQAPDPALVQQYNPGRAFLCAYIGTIGMACGLDVVLRAAKMLKDQGRFDIRFLLAGDGAVRSGLEESARVQGLDNVVFTGRVDREKVAAVHSICDVNLVHLRKTALFESVLPSKIFEAAAMERPIIMGVAGPARDLVLEAGMGVVMEPENENDLVARLLELASDRERAVAMGRQGRAFLLQHYNVETIATEYLSFLQSVVSSPKP